MNTIETAALATVAKVRAEVSKLITEAETAGEDVLAKLKGLFAHDAAPDDTTDAHEALQVAAVDAAVAATVASVVIEEAPVAQPVVDAPVAEPAADPAPAAADTTNTAA